MGLAPFHVHSNFPGQPKVYTRICIHTWIRVVGWGFWVPLSLSLSVSLWWVELRNGTQASGILDFNENVTPSGIGCTYLELFTNGRVCPSIDFEVISTIMDRISRSQSNQWLVWYSKQTQARKLELWVCGWTQETPNEFPTLSLSGSNNVRFSFQIFRSKLSRSTDRHDRV